MAAWIVIGGMWVLVVGLTVVGRRVVGEPWRRRLFGPRRQTRLARTLVATFVAATATNAWGLETGLAVSLAACVAAEALDQVAERRGWYGRRPPSPG